ncbi:MAG: hypothetical protein RLZZ301_1436 [Bacteroidota bacterium]|jgi:phage-related holin
MKRLQFYAEIIGDFFIPLLGFLFWDWNLYFILLYVLLDYCIRVVHVCISPQITKKQQVLRPLVFLITFVVISHFYMVLSTPTWMFLPAFSDFFWYEDLYIPQGFILLPLLVYSEVTRIRMGRQFDPAFSLEKSLLPLGNRLLGFTLIFMTMCLILAVSQWSHDTERWFFLLAFCAMIVYDHRRVFISA